MEDVLVAQYKKFVEETYGMPFEKFEQKNKELADWIMEKQDKGITKEEFDGLFERYHPKLLDEIARPIGERCDICGEYFNVDKIEFVVGKLTGDGHACCGEPGARRIPTSTTLKINWPLRGYEGLEYKFVINEKWLANFKNDLIKKINLGEELPESEEWDEIRQILSGEITFPLIYSYGGNLCVNCYEPEFSPAPDELIARALKNTSFKKYLEIVPKDELEKVLVVK